MYLATDTEDILSLTQSYENLNISLKIRMPWLQQITVWLHHIPLPWKTSLSFIAYKKMAAILNTPSSVLVTIIIVGILDLTFKNKIIVIPARNTWWNPAAGLQLPE